MEMLMQLLSIFVGICESMKMKEQRRRKMLGKGNDEHYGYSQETIIFCVYFYTFCGFSFCWLFSSVFTG